jgi:hypothetical protein
MGIWLCSFFIQTLHALVEPCFHLLSHSDQLQEYDAIAITESFEKYERA